MELARALPTEGRGPASLGSNSPPRESAGYGVSAMAYKERSHPIEQSLRWA